MTPTVGRIVHYQSFGTPGAEYLPEPQAAIITRVHEDYGTAERPETRVDLAVFYDNGLSFKRNVIHADEPTSGRWNWPPRVA